MEPSHQGSPPQINMNSTQKLAINKEIKRLLTIGCIKEVKRTERLFLSNIFTVPKKNGDLRLVINLKDLNQFRAFHHFKMESFQTAKVCCSYPTESGDSLCYVFRRPPDFWEDQVRLPSKDKESNDTVTRAGVHNKYKEINLRAHSADRVSGPNSGLNPDESVSPRTKGFRPDRILSGNFINEI